MRLKIISIAIVILILCMYLSSKPDRGGIERCSTIFLLPELHELPLTQKTLYNWDFFEDPKFQFIINEGNFHKLKSILNKNCYSQWSRGDLQYGSQYIGGQHDDDHISCNKKTETWNYYWSYSKKDGLLYAVTFRN